VGACAVTADFVGDNAGSLAIDIGYSDDGAGLG
jgi:hypothetical protein